MVAGIPYCFRIGEAAYRLFAYPSSKVMLTARSGRSSARSRATASLNCSTHACRFRYDICAANAERVTKYGGTHRSRARWSSHTPWYARMRSRLDANRHTSRSTPAAVYAEYAICFTARPRQPAPAAKQSVWPAP